MSTTLSIRKCILHLPASVLGQENFELTLPDPWPVAVLGPNGSGKSLFTAVLRALFSFEILPHEVRKDLATAGIDRVEMDLEIDTSVLAVSMSLATGERHIHWNSYLGHDEHEGANNRLPSDLTLGWRERLFSTSFGQQIFANVNVVCGGDLQLPLDDAFFEALKEEAIEPLRRELASWRLRLLDLGGEQGQGGRFEQEKQVLREIEDRIAYVEGIEQKLEEARRVESDLHSQHDTLIARHSVVKAELEEWLKLTTLADRAKRVDSWLDEIRREYTDVAWLRDQHGRHQERLDELEKLFRGAPDDLDSIIESYQDLRREESRLVDVLTEARLQEEQLNEAVLSARTELDAFSPPDTSTLDDRQKRNLAEIDRFEREIDDLLHHRVELVRLREGLQARIQKDFALFHTASSSQRHNLAAYFEWLGQSRERAVVRERAAANEARLRQERRERLRLQLSAEFQGFESLPGAAPDLLRELFDRRRLQSTLKVDQEEIGRRRLALEHSEKKSGKSFWSIVSGLVGAAIGARLGGWDFALLFGLAAAGIVLAVTKLIYDGFEKRLESVVQAQNMISGRIAETDEAINRLTGSLTPLSHYESLSDAMEALDNYRSLRAEWEDISLASGEDETVPADEALPEFARQIPAPLLSMPADIANIQYQLFQEAERTLRMLDDEWSEYEEGGVRFERKREIESAVLRLKTDLEEIAVERDHLLQDHESRRRQLSERLTELEADRAGQQQAHELESQLTLCREKIGAVTLPLASLSTSMSPEQVMEQAAILRDLRSQIRRIRDSLSSRQALDELRARESLLAEELENVKQKVSGLDPLYLLDGTVADYATKYSRQLEASGEALANAENMIENLNRELENVEVSHWSEILSKCEPKTSLQDRAALVREQITRTGHDLDVAREAVVNLQQEFSDQYANHREELIASISEVLQNLSDSRYLSILVESGTISVKLADGSTRSLSSLSTGMKDLIWIAVRLAILNQRSGSPLTPVIWDEPFAHLDDDILQRVHTLFSSTARDRQVIMLSRDRRLEPWGSVVHLPAVKQDTEYISA